MKILLPLYFCFSCFMTPAQENRIWMMVDSVPMKVRLGESIPIFVSITNMSGADLKMPFSLTASPHSGDPADVFYQVHFCGEDTGNCTAVVPNVDIQFGPRESFDVMKTFSKRKYQLYIHHWGLVQVGIYKIRINFNTEKFIKDSDRITSPWLYIRVVE